MKKVLFLYSFLVACNFFSCKDNSGNNVYINESQLDTIKKTYYLNRKTIDSLWLENIKENALADISCRFEGKELDYIFYPRENSLHFSYIKVGNFFDNQNFYAIIYTKAIGIIVVDLYKLTKNNSFEQKISSESFSELVQPMDTIFDANGDGEKDFLINFYPASGCCMRDVYIVYLSPNKKEGKITNSLEFMNPTFFPEEQVIRGVDYGHPGEVGLYTYRWKGEEVDTLEYIYPDYTTRGKTFIKTGKSCYYPTKEEGIPLKKLPEEYKKINGLYWFFLYDEKIFDNILKDKQNSK
ncbi:MAG: hypothetical protein Q3983_05385 [Capnocytophaga sp.]|nr:hypothetical protein [Capnocytophaga sp.]